MKESLHAENIELNDELKEFFQESTELLDSAETNLLKLDKSGDFNSIYAAVFRVFHSLKGGAGMFGLAQLNHHMHSVENILTQLGARKCMTAAEVTFFLNSIDAARKIMDGETVEFNYEIDSASKPETPPVEKTEPKKETLTSVSNEKKYASDPITPNSASTQKTHPVWIGLAYIIDDEIEVLEILQEMLNSASIETKIFSNPIEAIELIKKNPPDLVITDMKMPQLSGLDILDQTKKIDSELPVIYISAYLDKKILIDSINMGVHAAFEKPFKENNVIPACISAIKLSKMSKYFNQSINLMLYQFADLEDFMKSKGQNNQAKTLKTELNNLIEFRKKIRSLKKAS